MVWDAAVAVVAATSGQRQCALPPPSKYRKHLLPYPQLHSFISQTSQRPAPALCSTEEHTPLLVATQSAALRAERPAWSHIRTHPPHKPTPSAVRAHTKTRRRSDVFLSLHCRPCRPHLHPTPQLPPDAHGRDAHDPRAPRRPFRLAPDGRRRCPSIELAVSRLMNTVY